MTLNISLSPESEALLRARAAAAGQDITAFVSETIKEKLAGQRDIGPTAELPQQGTEEWFAKFNEWVASHPARSFLANDSRDVIYDEEQE